MALNATEGSGSRGAQLFIDLVRFKQVNDKYGHATGDAVLLAAAQRMLDAVRESASVSRVGGDELSCCCRWSQRTTAPKRQGLPHEVATALLEAIGWLQDLRVSEQLSPDLVARCRWILRHFPRRWEVEHQREATGQAHSILWPRVDEWIRPE